MANFDYEELKGYYKSMMRDFDQLEQRLAKEHLALELFIRDQTDISYRLKDYDELPPRQYKIKFKNLKSITGIREDQSPMFGNEHVLEVKIPSLFPVEPAVCYITTPVWHPNIQSETGPFKGRICGNTEGFGAFYSLDKLILRIRDMLGYKIYHAEFTYPYPEDEGVAKWVREFAEPEGWVRNGLGISEIQIGSES